MSITRIEQARFADQLLFARTTVSPVAPLTEMAPNLTLADAYGISEINLNARLSQEGGRLIGKKIGLTSRAVQKQLGVGEPDFGYLLSQMQVPLGESVSRGKMILPRVEGELAFVLKKDLRGPNLTAADVIRATDFLLPCIEIIDSRVKDWKIKIQDTVADNASSAYFVLGTEPKKLGTRDLRMAGMNLKVNGEVVSTGCGAACLDHPVNAVVWLANTLGKWDVPLRAGEVILSGAFGPVVPVNAGDQVEVSIAGFAPVHCNFGE